MASSLDDFRQRARKTIVLPSGLSVTVHFCHMIDLIGRVDLPVPSVSTMGDLSLRETYQYHRDLFDAMIVAACVAPRFAPRGTPEDVERVAIEDLEENDYCELGKAISHHSGFNPEVAALLDRFRTQFGRTSSEADSADVSRPAASSPPDDARPVLSELFDHDASRPSASVAVDAPASADSDNAQLDTRLAHA
jgi:hypothetical protein